MSSRDSIETIVVGVDGSVQSGQALAWAVKLARCACAEVVAVFAIPPPNYFEYGAGYGVPVIPAELDPEWRAGMISDFKKVWTLPLAQSGLAYRTVVMDGRPAEAIAKVADEVNADLVVVGRRGRGGVAEMLLGSVSNHLSHHCKHPLLLVSKQAVEPVAELKIAGFATA